MKTIFKSFKFRIYPNGEQEVLMAKHFGACRFVFNHYLNKRKESYLEDNFALYPPYCKTRVMRGFYFKLWELRKNVEK
jgi:transposase